MKRAKQLTDLEKINKIEALIEKYRSEEDCFIGDSICEDFIRKIKKVLDE